MISRCRGIADDFCARRLTVNRVIAAFAEKFAALFLEMAQAFNKGIVRPQAGNEKVRTATSFEAFADGFAQAYRAARWLMGDLDVGSFEPLVAAVPAVIAPAIATVATTFFTCVFIVDPS